MKWETLFVSSVIAVLALVLVAAIPTSAQSEVAKLRRATEQFHRTEVAQTAGYDLVSGLDHCFDNPGVGAMGYHYIDTSSLDTALDPLRPEAIVYAPDKNGKLHLAAVEYIVPVEPWDAENSELPMLFGQHFHLNEALGVYVLHAWIWKNNPLGMFEDWNPSLSCP